MEIHSKLTATVVGAGAGGMLSVNGLEASSRFELLAVADVSVAARDRVVAEFGGRVSVFASHAQMIAECPAEILCVSTYAPSHVEVATAAIDQGAVRGLLVEKPIAEGTRSGQELISLIKGRGLPVVVPHGLMAQPAALAVIEELRSGGIGDLHTVEVRCTQWDLINAGIHWIQFVLAVMEPLTCTTVLAAADTSTRTFRDGLQVETESIVMARFESGIRLLMNFGDDIPVGSTESICLLRFVGSNGVLEYGAFENKYTVVSSGRNRERVDVPRAESTGHRVHLEHLADQVQGIAKLDYAIPEQSLRALEIVEAAYESRRVGGSVMIPLDGPQPERQLDWDPGAPYTGSGGGRDGRQLA